MKRISLSNKEWKVKGFWPWVPLLQNSMELGQELLGVTNWLPASVPGGVHADLYREGLIEDPYWEQNSLKCEWVENRWWLYQTSFRRPDIGGAKIELEFTGLDYEALVYVNGTLLGEHIGMFHSAVFDLTQLCKENETLQLQVLFKHAPDEMAQIGKTSLTFTQKSRFNYKWDFSTRLVNIGIWDDVYLNVYDAYAMTDVHVRTDADLGGAVGNVNVKFGLRRLTEANESALLVRYALRDTDGGTVAAFERPIESAQSEVEHTLAVPNPRLWFPNGYGEQHLYALTTELMADGRIVDTYEMKVGIRQIEYVSNEDSPEGALPYTVVVNGKKIYIQGANLVPLDHVYGNITPERYEWIVYKAKQAHMNMIRVWGGGLIEKTVFYELCDRYGILVWQDFIQSSSGIDNVPSQIPAFLSLLRTSAESAIVKRRNHTSLAIWCGGNELMSEHDHPSTFEDENIAMLKQLTDTLDPGRLFLPTTASWPVEFISEPMGTNHDVHGHWLYLGNPRHYELYGSSDSLFHSEFGTNGLSPVKSLQKFLSEDQLKPASMKDNLVWRHHGEWWDAYERDLGLFGEIRDLRQFCATSQWVQAEGLRYILEANARRKFRNSGSLIWQINEPWPNVSCSSLIDYYGEAKMAYDWAKNAFAPLHASLDYRKLDYAVGERFAGQLFAASRTDRREAELRMTVRHADGTVLYGETRNVDLSENVCSSAGELAFPVTEAFGSLFFVKLEISGEDGQWAESAPYVFSTNSTAVYAASLDLNGAKVAAEQVGQWEEDAGMHVGTFKIANEGNQVALHVHATETTDAYWTDASDNYVTLFPRESRTIEIRCVPKREDEYPFGGAGREAISKPSIAFACLNERA